MKPKSWKMLLWASAGAAFTITTIWTVSAFNHALKKAYLMQPIFQAQAIQKAWLAYSLDAATQGAELRPMTVKDLINGGFLSKEVIKGLDVSGVVLPPFKWDSGPAPMSWLTNNPLPLSKIDSDNEILFEVKTPHGKIIMRKGGDAAFYNNKTTNEDDPHRPQP